MMDLGLISIMYTPITEAKRCSHILKCSQLQRAGALRGVPWTWERWGNGGGGMRGSPSMLTVQHPYMSGFEGKGLDVVLTY